MTAMIANVKKWHWGKPASKVSNSILLKQGQVSCKIFYYAAKT